MRYRRPIVLLVLPFTAIVFAALLSSTGNSVTSQTRDKRVDTNAPPAQNQNSNEAKSTSTPPPGVEVVKVDVDLVKVDALVLQKNTARIVGGLKKEDFAIYEDGTRQEITHFSQDSLPLSLLFLIDRACIDPYVDEVRRAAREAIERLKPVDEIAVMSYDSTTTLVQPFTTNRIMIENGLNSVPAHDKVALHCLNNVFTDAANYMIKASNPTGRRVVIVISAVTRAEVCPAGPSGKSAEQSIYESGSVVCGIIPKVSGQALENGIMIMTTRMTRLTADYMDIQTMANETGGEVFSDKPEKLDTTFQTLIDHLRSRYNLAFVSTNKKRDGTMRKLKLDVAPPIQKRQVKLVVKARKSYVAPRK